MKTPAALLGAVDRFNYGDLLFPLVVRAAWDRLGVGRPLTVYAMRESDLSAFGALPSRSYRQLLADVRAGEVSGLVLAGGEMLGARWHTMAIYLGSPLQRALLKAARRVLGADAVDRLVGRSYGAAGAWPWVISPAELPRPVPIVYNAVGGVTALERAAPAVLFSVVERLKAARYVAVRDERTRALLAGAGLPSVRLVPDSAVLIGELFPLDELAARVRPELRRLVDEGPYFALQANVNVGVDIALALGRQLERVEAELNVRPFLLPIGRAAGHEDQVALGRVAAATRARAAFAPVDASVIEIMYVIARSAAYVGTSLHGAITALAFDRPHLALSKRVPKLLAHLETWSLAELSGGIEPDDLARAVSEALAVHPARLRERREAAVRLAWEHILAMTEALA
ncbi:MAG TPA: polysaccharide pyruvyl transferase family protein [Trueperaceae bacterium]